MIVGSIEPLWKADAAQLTRDAIARYRPRKTFVLFSGGNDSLVLLRWATLLEAVPDAAVFIDTGTALPGVREFVEATAARLAIPLLVYEAGDAYERMVMRWGFPGPGAHRYPYVWLKERQLDALIRDHKRRWRDRILLLSGARRAESQVRMGHAIEVKRDGATVWANPLIDWTHADMRAYRAEHGEVGSDVAALFHRSGECNCGAFAAPGEREMLRSLEPCWFERTAYLERRAECAGVRFCRWGEPRPREDNRAGPLCACASQPTLW